MRAVVAVGLVLALLAGSSRARPVPRPRELTCEEQCRADHDAADASCDEARLAEVDRGFCHQAARARLDVCLRICDD